MNIRIQDTVGWKMVPYPQVWNPATNSWENAHQIGGWMPIPLGEPLRDGDTCANVFAQLSDGKTLDDSMMENQAIIRSCHLGKPLRSILYKPFYGTSWCGYRPAPYYWVEFTDDGEAVSELNDVMFWDHGDSAGIEKNGADKIVLRPHDIVNRVGKCLSALQATDPIPGARFFRKIDWGGGVVPVIMQKQGFRLTGNKAYGSPLPIP